MARVAVLTMVGEITALNWTCASWFEVTSLRRLVETASCYRARCLAASLIFVEEFRGEPVFRVEVVLDFEFVVPLGQRVRRLVEIIIETVRGIVGQRIKSIEECQLFGFSRAEESGTRRRNCRKRQAGQRIFDAGGERSVSLVRGRSGA